MTRKLKNINFLILSVLFLLGFSVLYFLYYRQRSQANIYAVLNVKQYSTATNTQTSPSVPYWLDDAIKIGDKDVSILGGLNAIVLDKESFESGGTSRNVYLTLKINSIRDRSGKYLFKNKPLLVGSSLDLQLTDAQIAGLVLYLGTSLPSFEYKKIIVKGHDMAVERETADNLEVGGEIKDNKGQTIAKVLDKNINSVNSVGLFYDSRSQLFQGSENSTRVDLAVKLELLVKKVGNYYYFMQMQKIKPDEFVFVPLKEVSLNLLVTSVKD